jgi:hypothetical protein
MTIEVWYQLRIGDYLQGRSDAVYLKADSKIVNLTDAIKAKRTTKLSHCDAADLIVFLADGDPKNDEPIDPGEVIPTGTTSKTPLIVVAPASLFSQEVEQMSVDPETLARWNTASRGLQDQQQKHIVKTLPWVTGSIELQSNRKRWEERKFVLRKCYKGYEERLLPSSAETDCRKYGLIGPQGFGKTGLLRYLHAKYATVGDYLVVHERSFRNDNNAADACQDVRKAFYRACSLRSLVCINVGSISKLSNLILRIKSFAEQNKLTLLLILDQLKVVEDFRPLFEEINRGLDGSKFPHRVILSSSTSRTSKEVFSPHVHEHVRFQDFTSHDEAKELAIPNVPAEKLFPVSFLEAIRLVGGSANISIAEEARIYQQDWLSKVSERVKAEHMFVFHAVISEAIIEDADLLFSEDVDLDAFFWTVDSKDHRQIKEKRPGLAKMLLQRLKEEKQTHEQYLRFIVHSEYFLKLPQRTKGNILEDCISEVLSETCQEVEFQATKFDGNATSPKVLYLPCNREVRRFDGVSFDGDLFKKDQCIVAIPNDPDYTSIDFVVIYVHEDKKVRLWFIQITVSDPNSHGCKETENFKNWISALKMQGLEITHKRLVFMTPKATPVSDLSCIPSALKKSEVLHCNFTTTNGMSGNHMLIEALKKQGRFE